MLTPQSHKRNPRPRTATRVERLLTPLGNLLLTVAMFAGVAFCPARTSAHTAPPYPPQTNTPGTVAQSVQRPTKESIEAAKAAVDAATDLDDATKTKAKENYDAALKALEGLERAEKAAADFASLRDQVPQAVRQVETQLAGSFTKQEITPPEDSDLADLQQQLTQAQETHNNKTAELEAVKTERTNRQKRRAEIPQEKTTADETIAEKDRELAVAPPQGQHAAITTSRRMLLQLQRSQAQAIKTQADNELSFYEASLGVQLLQKRQDLLEKQIEVTRHNLEAWQKIVDAKRQKDAAQQVVNAKELRERAPEILKAKADDVVAAAEQRVKLAAEMAEAIRNRTNVEKQLSDINTDFSRIESVVKEVGLTDAIGIELRRIRDTLPSIADEEQIQQDAQRALRQMQLKQFEYEDRLDDLGDIPAEALALLVSLDATNIDDELLQSAQELLTLEREYLQQLFNDYDSYFSDLVALDTKTVQLIAKIEEYQQFIDERVLWIRSTNLPTKSDLQQAAKAAAWLYASPQAWGDLILSLGWDALQNPIPALLAIVLLVPWILSRRRARSKLKEIGRKTTRGSTQSFLPTLQSVALSLYLASLFPVVLLYLAWRLNAVENVAGAVDPARMVAAVDLARSVAAGLVTVAVVLFVLEFWRQICRSDGIAEAHFQWSSRALARLRRGLFLLIAGSFPLLFTYAAIAATENERWHNSLGRFCFCAALLVTVFFMHYVMNVKQGVFREHFAFRSESWLSRLKYFWWISALAAPAILSAAAIIGFYYTAEHLAAYWFATLAYLSSLLLVSAMLKRWIVVNRRRLAIQRARELRAAAQAALQNEEGSSDTSHAATPPPSEPEVDLSKIDLQTRRLIRSVLTVTAIAGVWLIWVNVLPALGILNTVELWDTTEVISVEALPTADGEPPTVETSERLRSVTLGDLFLALVVAAVIVVAAVNLPGVIEMLLLQRLPLQHGVRYAISTVSRYIIIVVGVILCSSQIGIGWSSVQWLIAALGVGLGFGLQEIFANFVSGLIILFERPVRLGDIITVGDVSGTVTKIRIRATTITDWDRKEFIVPNKEFVTGRVLNWTLTDSVSRVLINVGVAYGSDTKLVRSLLYEIVQSHDNVLAEPPPMVTFQEFGDSTLNFVVRAYLPNVDNRLATIHDLHETIDLRFREANIEIAFPQRDLHIRSQDGSFRIEQIHEETHVQSNGRDHSASPTPPEAETH